MIEFLYFEIRKLRYLRHGFRNYWFGEDMPYFRTVAWLRELVEVPAIVRVKPIADCPLAGTGDAIQLPQKMVDGVLVCIPEDLP